MISPLRLLFLSTSVGALGSGLGGGVELTLHNIAKALQNRGHQINIVAPDRSELADLFVTQIPGNLQETAQTQGRDMPITMPADAVLANMWEYARQIQGKYDLLLNFAYDWLPFYLTPFFDRPIAHLVSMGSLTTAMDLAIARVIDAYPNTIGLHSLAQADTFAFGDRCVVLGNGLDLSLYQFQPEPEDYWAWVGRIAPEKGIEDAIAAAEAAGVALKIWGAMPDAAYWQTICQTYPEANISYEGFLSTTDLQQAIGSSRGLLMTPKWIEAFGNVAIEALACGVPVIAYRRGGPAEIVENGKTGWLVEPDDIAELVKAMGKLAQIDRLTCRQRAKTTYSMTAMGDRVEKWLQSILETSSVSKKRQL
jgi:UDP-glucose:tetrahydrobiopterin glucosyltransferase